MKKKSMEVVLALADIRLYYKDIIIKVFKYSYTGSIIDRWMEVYRKNRSRLKFGLHRDKFLIQWRKYILFNK